MEKGKFYLFASPWFWTVVGRYLRHLNFQEIEVADAIYFTQTGATFDKLTTKGFNNNTKFHGPFRQPIIIPAAGLKFPWLAKVTWLESA